MNSSLNKDLLFFTISGVLDPSAESTALEEGTVLELPYWLVSALINEDSVDIELPKVYRDSYRYLNCCYNCAKQFFCYCLGTNSYSNLSNRNIFKADANIVDLFSLSKYFYEFGKLLSNLIDQKNSIDLCNNLNQVK